jgi:hypothetical protein
MNQKLRIRADLELEKLYEWPNPKHRPIKDPAKKFQREQERLDRDAALFKARATFAGL